MRIGFNSQAKWGVVCLLLTLTAVTKEVSGANCQTGCLNGGLMLYPNNIFGYCRCVCKAPFMGPRCQFLSRKRASPGIKWILEAADRPLKDEDKLIDWSQN